jgi:hypothetical protein
MYLGKYKFLLPPTKSTMAETNVSSHFCVKAKIHYVLFASLGIASLNLHSGPERSANFTELNLPQSPLPFCRQFTST